MKIPFYYRITYQLDNDDTYHDKCIFALSRESALKHFHKYINNNNLNLKTVIEVRWT